jgi:hypothetical protein
MSKEELDQRLATREIGPVGQLLLATGTIDELLRENESTWGLGHDVMHVKIASDISKIGDAADTDVRYILAASYSSPWTTTGHLPAVTRVCASEGERWAKAA